MIAKTKSPRTSLLKKIIVVPLMIASVLVFTKNETVAQKAQLGKPENQVLSTTKGVSQGLIDEYEAIVEKYNIVNGNKHSESPSLSQREKGRLLEIYQMMTKKQQRMQSVGFVPKRPVLGKRRPTDAQLKEWLDDKKYFVRINGWKTKNTELVNHQAADFTYYEYYEPNKGSTDFGKYTAQVNLMTNEGYKSYYDAWRKQDSLSLVVFFKPRRN